MTVWHVLFLLLAYTAGLSCLYGVYRIGVINGLAEGIRQLLIFIAFVVLFHLLESWARLRVPYYYYPPVLPDMIATFPWDSYSWFPTPAPSECDTALPPDEGISFTVPLLEAALTYSVMWTAQLLRAPVLLQPFLAGLVFLAVDGFLDPVLAVSISCTSGVQVEQGLGFWEWYVHPGLGTEWFGIPLFNYAAWYAAPLALVSLVKIAGWLGLLAAWAASSATGPPTPPPTPSALELAFLVIVFVAFLLIFALAPTFPWPVAVQGLILVIFIAGTLIATLWFAGGYKHDNAFRWEFIYPQLVCVAFPWVAFLGSGLLLSIPYLWIVGLVTGALVVLYSLSPYVDLGP